MRELTVKRHKSAIGCAIKVNLYIQDELSNEVAADGIRFRKLGAIKNGTEISFEIECDELVLFASVDDALVKAIKSVGEMSVEVSHAVMDKIIIPAGRESVIVSGKNKLNPLKGNPFIFDTNN